MVRGWGRGASGGSDMRGMRGSWQVVFCFSVWVLVTQASSFYENSSACALRTCVLFRLCILYFKKKFTEKKRLRIQIVGLLLSLRIF